MNQSPQTVDVLAYLLDSVGDINRISRSLVTVKVCHQTFEESRVRGLRVHKHRVEIERSVAAGSTPRRAYLVAQRGVNGRWFVTRDDLAGFSLAKGTVRFTPEQPIPADVLDRLIAARVAEIEG